MKERRGFEARVIFVALLLIVLAVSVFWPTIVCSQTYQMRQDLYDGDGALLSYALTFAALCLIGIACLFFGCLVKFDNHSSTPKFYSTCFQIAKDEAGMFAGLAFIISIPFVLIPIIAYFVVLAIISKEITIEGVIAAAAVGYFCAIVVVLRKVLRDIKADKYFKNTSSTKSLQSSMDEPVSSSESKNTSNEIIEKITNAKCDALPDNDKTDDANSAMAKLPISWEKDRDGRFVAYSNGTVLDTITNLMWAAKDNGCDINWANAKSYCENYRGGGYSDWRMPSPNELLGLYDPSKSYKAMQMDSNVHLTELIQLSTSTAWASETQDFEATIFFFSLCLHYSIRQSYDGGSRALPVRSGKIEAPVKSTRNNDFYAEAGDENKDHQKTLRHVQPSLYNNMKEYICPILNAKFVLIPAGTFMMGSAENESYRGDGETLHQVTISKPFYLQKTPVTQRQWEVVMGNNPSEFKGEDMPVETLSWDDVQEYIQKLNELSGESLYRLPTEAEWEYACRAGSNGRYCFGSDKTMLGEYAWGMTNSNGTTHPVGLKRPNAWGLYDMHGNICEWVQDWYGENYYGKSPHDDPKGPSSGSLRVLRGGSWFFSQGASARGRNYPGERNNHHGFRLVASAIPPPDLIESDNNTQKKEQGNEILGTYQGLTAVEWFNEAYALMRWDDKEPKKAIEYFNNAIELEPDYANDTFFCARRGNAYSDLGQYERAIEDYDDAIRLDPDWGNNYFYRGLAYRKLGQYERAIKDYNRAIRLDPDDAENYYNKACCCALQNKAKQACKWLQLAIERGYNNWKHIREDKDFDNIRKESCFINLLEEAEKTKPSVDTEGF